MKLVSCIVVASLASFSIHSPLHARTPSATPQADIPFAREDMVDWGEANRAALIDALSHRNRHGLDHIWFLPNDADRSAAPVRDAAYTQAALGYAAALAHGLIDPSGLHDVYTLARPNADLRPALAAAVGSGTLGAWLEGLPPQDAAYRQLSDAYISASQAPMVAAPMIASTQSLHPGAIDPRTLAIAEQLVEEGYLGAVSGEAAGGVYTDGVANAVRILQRDYPNRDSGIAEGATCATSETQDMRDMAMAFVRSLGAVRIDALPRSRH